MNLKKQVCSSHIQLKNEFYKIEAMNKKKYMIMHTPTTVLTIERFPLPLGAIRSVKWVLHMRTNKSIKQLSA
jgi:hypothetical protein